MIAFTLTSTYWLWLVGGLYLAGPALIAIGVALQPSGRDR
jgi:hypothetical protein